LLPMCGISGIISLNREKVNLPRLRQMSQSLAHRGPDGEDVYINPGGNAGFAHRRLAIIDKSPAAAQPMHIGKRYTIVHNGEIYNYRELRATLERAGYTFRTESDTEVVVTAYQHYGNECLQHFDGMFAFAIWDEAAQTLFAARDRFGEKPFFYFIDEEELVFASEMKALWAAGVSREVNEKMLYNYITLGYTQNPEDAAETFFTNIQKLPARSFLQYDARSHQLIQEVYWDITIHATRQEASEQELINQFSYLLQQSVTRRLRSDVPVGTSLSGGLDSSAVLRMVTDITSAPVKTFSAIFPGFERDESRYVQEMTAATQSENVAIQCSIDEVISNFETVCYHQEEPFQSASVLAQFSVYKTARQQGIPVLLDGQGADEILAGYHKYYPWYWLELFRSNKKRLQQELAQARAAGVTVPWSWKNKLAAWFPSHAAVWLKRMRTRQQRHHPDLDPAFLEVCGQSYYTIPHIDNLNGVLYYNTLINGLEELLRYADRNAMAHGVEVRLPFLNHELVQFVFALPSAYKIRDGRTKWILRKSMENLLPATITGRTDKVGFEPPQLQWMQDRRLQEYIHESRRRLVKYGILRATALQKIIRPMDAHAAGNNDWKYLLAGRLV